MNALSETESAAPEGRPGRPSLMGPAALALGGCLSLIWSCALGLYAYDLVRWLFA